MLEKVPSNNGALKKPDILSPAQREAFEKLSSSVQHRARRTMVRDRFFSHPRDENGNVDYSFSTDVLKVESPEAFLRTLKLEAALGDNDAKQLLAS
ncbi:MAG: hypothetical protein RIQ56_351 [Candidatus Parcubacteria bacterium]|jgi:hypothetical protein